MEYKGDKMMMMKGDMGMAPDMPNQNMGMNTAMKVAGMSREMMAAKKKMGKVMKDMGMDKNAMQMNMSKPMGVARGAFPNMESEKEYMMSVMGGPMRGR